MPIIYKHNCTTPQSSHSIIITFSFLLQTIFVLFFIFLLLNVIAFSILSIILIKGFPSMIRILETFIINKDTIYEKKGGKIFF